MDIVMMVLYLAIVLSILVFVHEGGHYLAARAFGVRVTEFMIGLPGPNIGFTWKGDALWPDRHSAWRLCEGVRNGAWQGESAY